MFPHLTASWDGCIFPGKAWNGGPGHSVKSIWACSPWAPPTAYSKRHKTPKTWCRQTVWNANNISLAWELLIKIQKNWGELMIHKLFLLLIADSDPQLWAWKLCHLSLLHVKVRVQARCTWSWQGFFLNGMFARGLLRRVDSSSEQIKNWPLTQNN